MNKVQQWLAKNLVGIDVKALSGSFTPPVFSTGSIPVTFIGDNNAEFVREGYGANDIVYSILSIAAEKERMAPWAVYKVKDESSLKHYELEMQKAGTPDFNLKLAQDLRTKALELYTGDGKLNKILDWPNDQETFNDIVANSGISKRATGNRYIKGTLLDSGPNKGKPQELHLLPAQHVSITATGTFPSRPYQYTLQLGSPHNFTPNEIMHDKLPNPDYDIAGYNLYGMAPLRAARKILARSKSSLTASVKSFDNLGPEELIFVDDNRIDPDTAVAQADATKKRLNEMSGASHRKKIAVSGYKMGAVKLGVSPVDLGLVESDKWDYVRIANVYNFPHVLLLPDNSTYNNLETAERALTSRCCLPYLVSFRSHFNRKLRTDWGYKGENIYVDFDLSVYAELQKNMKDLTDWVMKAWHLTIRQRYELMQLEIPDAIKNRPELDMIFVPAGMTEIGQLNPDNIIVPDENGDL